MKTTLHNSISFCFTLLLTTFALSGCGDARLNSIDAYAAYLQDPENGFAVTAAQEEVRITVKFLPPPYVAYLELAKNNAPLQGLDSTTAAYSRSLTFQLILEPSASNQSLTSILYRGAPDRSARDARDQLLNYGMEEYIRLVAGGKTAAPVLSLLESTLEADRKLSFLFVFDRKALPELSAGDMTFVLDKTFFLDNPVHLPFNAEIISRYPQFYQQNH